jgi:hypothetical protein
MERVVHGQKGRWGVARLCHLFGQMRLIGRDSDTRTDGRTDMEGTVTGPGFFTPCGCQL